MHVSTRVKACNATDKQTQKATENINQMLADDSIVMVDLDINSCCQKDPFLAFPYFRHTGSRNSKDIPRHGGDGSTRENKVCIVRLASAITPVTIL